MAKEEEANIASSKGILITTFSFIINMPRQKIEEVLKNSDYVEDYEIEDLDDRDIRKDVFVVLRDPVDVRYLGDIIKNLFKK